MRLSLFTDESILETFFSVQGLLTPKLLALHLKSIKSSQLQMALLSLTPHYKQVVGSLVYFDRVKGILVEGPRRRGRHITLGPVGLELVVVKLGVKSRHVR